MQIQGTLCTAGVVAFLLMWFSRLLWELLHNGSHWERSPTVSRVMHVNSHRLSELEDASAECGTIQPWCL
jgi:hypothetical protein